MLDSKTQSSFSRLGGGGAQMHDCERPCSRLLASQNNADVAEAEGRCGAESYPHKPLASQPNVVFLLLKKTTKKQLQSSGDIMGQCQAVSR